MSVTLDNYGKADWTDYTDYWRDDDAEWLMSRAILRYATAAARNTDLPSPGVGQVTYRDDGDLLELRSKAATWVPVIAAQNLAVTPVSSAAPGDPVTLKQATASGGLVFAPSKVSASIPFDMGNGAVVGDTTGLTVSTGAGSAKLTTTATHLKSSLPIEALSGQSHLSSLDVDGATVIGGTLSAAGITATGVISAQAGVSLASMASASGDRAARKDYVDNAINSLRTEVGGDYVSLTGDTMSGYLQIAPGQDTCLRLRAAIPLLEWRNAAATTRFAYINASAASMNVVSDAGDIVLNSGGGQVRASDGVWMNGQMRAYANGAAAVLIGPSNHCYLSFYSAGSSVDNIGTRHAYVGFPNSGYFYINNEANNSSTIYATDFAHAFQCGTTRSEVLRIQPSVMLVGKTGAGLQYAGCEMYETGSIYATRGGSGVPLFLNHAGGPADMWFIDFRRANSSIGYIRMVGYSGIALVSGCDYRMKDDLGPIPDAVAKVQKLRPHLAIYHGDEGRGIVETFTAHELQEVIPEAVAGEKDGDEMQGGSFDRIVPLLTAAVQELAAEIAVLKGAA